MEGLKERLCLFGAEDIVFAIRIKQGLVKTCYNWNEIYTRGKK